MRFEIDTTEKTITIKEIVGVSELIKELAELRINADEYKIISDVISVPYYPSFPTYPYPTTYEVTHKQP